jgi:tRNA threonylcarbamoyladenosine biosynthesis protein TsaE
MWSGQWMLCLTILLFYICFVETVFSIADIDSLALSILHNNQQAKKFAFYGDLGAGKTTLISAICRQLGVVESCSSPTFSIMQEYNGFYQNNSVQIAHMDWYRLKSIDDLYNAGLMEYLLNQSVYCFIEWPSIIPEAITNNIVQIHLSVVDEMHRNIKIV